MLSAAWNGEQTFPVPESVRQLLSVHDYDALYLHSITFPEQYWGSVASELVWERPWEKVLHCRSDGSYEWFTGGLFNITVNALDRHASGKNRNKVALICAYEDGSELLVTYDRLLRRVSQTANGLKAAGVQKGDRVAIILPPGPEAVGAMLAAARIGALHAFLYPELGVAPLRARLEALAPKVVICGDVLQQGGQVHPLYSIVSAALEGLESVELVLVHRRVKPALSLTGDREKDFIDYIDEFPQWCDPVPLQATDPLFIVFTSGSGSAPRGIVHSHGSYAVAAYHFGKTLIGVQDSDILWTLAELSWIVGHTAMVYMPLLCGSTSFIRAGSVFYPEDTVFWKLVQRHGINVVTTTPRMLRALRQSFTEEAQRYDRSSLRLLLSAGDHLSPALHQWWQETILVDRGVVANSWWQTEVATPALASLPFFPAKAGKVGKAMPGVIADVVSEECESLSADVGGYLVFRRPLLAMLSSVWNEPEAVQQYWQRCPETFWTGDLAMYDDEGYFTILGRADESFKLAGQRIDLAEIELLLLLHPLVEEAVAFSFYLNETLTLVVVLLLKPSEQSTPHLEQVFREFLQKELGSLPALRLLFVETLPRTKSGSVDRRALRMQVERQLMQETAE